MKKLSTNKDLRKIIRMWIDMKERRAFNRLKHLKNIPNLWVGKKISIPKLRQNNAFPQNPEIK